MQYDEFKRIFNEKSTELGCTPTPEHDIKEQFDLIDQETPGLTPDYKGWKIADFSKGEDGMLDYYIHPIRG